MSDVWLFGYGSLIWRPDFPFIDRRAARVHGWVRRFWQGSHDHRGTTHAPGRVATLIPQTDGVCDGIAYLIERAVCEHAFEHLDHREKNGYERHDVSLRFAQAPPAPGLVYIASRDNHAYLGPAPVDDMADQIRRCTGPSGSNLEYLLELAAALGEMGVSDPHVAGLVAATDHARR